MFASACKTANSPEVSAHTSRASTAAASSNALFGPRPGLKSTVVNFCPLSGYAETKDAMITTAATPGGAPNRPLPPFGPMLLSKRRLGEINFADDWATCLFPLPVLRSDKAIRAVQPLPSGPRCVLGDWCESLPGYHLYYAKSPTANAGFHYRPRRAAVPRNSEGAAQALGQSWEGTMAKRPSALWLLMCMRLRHT